MALFNRVNLNALSLLNHCYCKFITSTIRLKSNKHVTASYNISHEVIAKRSEKTRTSGDTKTAPFETELINRRNQACRSVLVQVYSSNSHVDLQSYCSQFGTILSMHYYRTDKQRHYILVEFKDETSVKEVISSASFMDSNLIIPVRSSILWFRKTQNTKSSYKIQKNVQLTMEDTLYYNPKQISHILYNAKSMSGQILHLYDVLKLSELETRLRFHTARHLEQYFSGLFYRIQVLPFGSSTNGFGRKRCDLDLVLVPDGSKENYTNGRLVFHSKSMKMNERYETKEFMGVLASTMQYFIPGVENVRRILEARVPIIKFNFEYTNLECDLSTTSMSAVYMSELLNLFGEIDWRVRPLALMIRKWAQTQEITNDSPGPWITNYSLSLMVLFYLQQKNILPSLRLLRTYATHDDVRSTENGIDCTFLRDVHKLPSEYKYKSNQDNLESLLFDFLEYYSTFDFYSKGICIREGIPIRKPSRSALHIVNPLETTLNVSKNVNTYELNRLTEKMHDAVFMLETSDKSKLAAWGIMKLLKLKVSPDITNTPRLDVADGSNAEDSPQDVHSHEIAENVNDDDIQPKKKEETV